MTNDKHPSPEQLFSDPSFLLSDIDCERDLAIFFRTTAEEIRQSSFLDQRIQTKDKTLYQMPLADFLAMPVMPEREWCTRYIFHISHVGSTLVAKLLGLPTGVGVLREPFLLRKLSLLYGELDRPEARFSRETFDRIFVNALSLLSRRRPSENCLLVKCTSYTNNIVPLLFHPVPQARGIALYLPLRAYITTIFNNEAGWLDIRQQAPSRLVRLHQLLGEAPFVLHQLQPGELVAMSWASEMLTLYQASRANPDRIKFVNFDTFLSDMHSGIRDVAGFLHLDFTGQDIKAIMDSKEISTYSKGTHAYNTAIRTQELNDTYARNARLIHDGIAWMDSAAARFTALHPLTSDFPT